MKKLFKISVGLLIMISVLILVVWQTSADSQLKVYFFDVGQGDAILIRTPSHQNIIIDGGPDNSFITQLGQVLPFYDRTIDLMILTHAHDDHLFGLVEVLKRYDVKMALYSNQLAETNAYKQWLELISQKNIPLLTAGSGQQFIFGDEILQVIYPFADFDAQSAGNLNDGSVVVRLTDGDFDYLFMGDLEESGEREILEKYHGQLQSEVIKIGHHGSITSSAEEFIKKINPQYAIIQVGVDNSFGHPSLRILNRLKRLGLQILRTDQLGTIFFKNGQLQPNN